MSNPSNYDEYNDQWDSADEGKSKSKHLGRVKRALKAAEKLRKDNKWDEKWSRFIQIYSNQYPYPELGGYEDVVVPNMIFSTVNVIVPSISVQNPKITVTAKRQQDGKTAEVVEAVVNHQWRAWSVQQQVRAATKDFVLLGLGWLKVTWDSKIEKRPVTPDEWQQAAQQLLMERQTAMETSPLGEDEFPSIEDVLATIPDEVDEVVKDAPLVERISNFDMFVDPDAMELKDARWIAQRRFEPIEVAKRNPEYKRSVRSKLKSSVLSEVRKDVEVTSGEGDERPKDAEFAVIYEFYDLVNGTVCTFSDGVDDYLIDPVKSPFPDGHPFVMMPNYEVPERFYPMGDVESIYPLQLELAITRTAMINDRKRGRRIVLMRSSALGPDGVDDLRSGKDNVMIDVLGDTPFGDVFQQVQSAGLHPEWYGQSEMIGRDIDLVSGVGEYARGVMPEIRRTATEAGLIQDQQNARSSDKLSKVERAMAQVAERMIRLSQQFMDSQDVAKIVSDDQVVSWVEYDREAIQGDFTFEVEAGSSQPQNESFRRQSALQMMDAMAPFMGSGLVNEAKLLEHLLRHGFGVKNTEDFIFQQEMVPVEVVQQMMAEMGGGQPPMGAGGGPAPAIGQ